MTWVKIQSSVARNRKFVKAGPAPSWLWLCGVAYCQEGLTDGFISTEAIDYLGVKNAKRLAAHLVTAGLWDVADGGWQVHDYLEHNRSAADVDLLRHDRRQAGKNGGVASGMARRKQDVKQTETVCFDAPEANAKQVSKQPSNPVQISTDQISTGQLQDRTATEAVAVSMDVAFRKFQDAYPQGRRKGGHLLEQAFIAQAAKAGGFDPLMAALANHRASAQWQDPKLIPGMDVWLNEERWRQRLDGPAAEPQGPSKAWPNWKPKTGARP